MIDPDDLNDEVVGRLLQIACRWMRENDSDGWFVVEPSGHRTHLAVTFRGMAEDWEASPEAQAMFTDAQAALADDNLAAFLTDP